MKKLVWIHSVLGSWALLGFTPTLATNISWNLAPSSPIVVSGQSVNVDVLLSGKPLGRAPSIGSFQFDVTFDAAVLSPTKVTFGPFLGDPGKLEALTDVQLFPGVVDFAEVSLLSPAQLDAVQPTNFSLATLSFTALTSGNTSLAFSQDIVDDAFGNKIPEPGTLALLALGTLGLLARTSLRVERRGSASADGAQLHNLYGRYRSFWSVACAVIFPQSR